MHYAKPIMSVQRFGTDAQPLEIVENIGFDAFQPWLGRTEVVCVDTECEILGLNQTVVAAGKLILEHGGVFCTDAVKRIALRRDIDALGKGILGSRQIHKGKLELDRAIEIIEEITPCFKDRGFILVLRKLVVDVLILNGFGVVRIGDTADAVRPHTLIRNAVLRRLFFLIRPVRSDDGGFDLLTLGAAQLFYRGQFDTPPGLIGLAVQARHKNCWSYRGAVSVSERRRERCFGQ